MALIGAAIKEWWRRLPQVFLLIVVIDAPYYLVWDGSVRFLGIPAEAADQLFALLGAFLGPLMGAALVFMQKTWREGGRVTFQSVAKTALSYWTPLFVIYVALSLILCGWLLICAIPAFLAVKLLEIENLVWVAPFLLPAAWIMTRYALVEPACVLEGLTGAKARWRSRELTTGHAWTIFLVGAVSLPPAWAMEFWATGIAEALLPHPVPAYLGGVALELVASAFGTLAYFVFFEIYWQKRGSVGAEPSKKARKTLPVTQA